MSSILPFHDNDLAYLPEPSAIEIPDYSVLFAERKAAYNAENPLLLNEEGQPVTAEAVLVQTNSERYWKVPVDDNASLYYVDLPSDPVNRLLAVDTYRELQQITRINTNVLSVMPAYASGADLEHIASRYGIHRLTITEATDTTEAVLETDSALRRRMMLVIEGYARGGSVGWYLFNALSASGLVKDALITSPSPCEIIITILSHDGDGTASAELLDDVKQYIFGRYTRVLGDNITVQSAEVIHYAINATIEFYAGPSAALSTDDIKISVEGYREQSEKIGHIIAQSGIDQALHRPGVYRAIVNTPSLPVLITQYQAPYCDSLTINGVLL